nr:hypothetical protein [Tanacetum cinerariifolium]
MADVNINAPAGQAPAMAPPFWDTVQYYKIAGCYRCQLDEQWFVLTKDTLRESLQITPVNNQPFISPPSSDALINFVNELGYPKIWEDLTQSIHNFIEDKWNLTRHTSGKKKATLIVIPSIRFTKLIIHHLQRRNKFYPRPDSSLHLPNEEHVLGYLKFSAKGTKREVFGMPIPGSDPESPAPKPTKPVRKPKLTAPKAKKRTLKYVAESVAEDAPVPAPAKEPHVAAEDSDLQKALEESMKSMYDVPQGPLPPVVIREPESGKYQSLLEVPGKGKAKARPDPGAQAEGQTGLDAGTQDEGQAGSNPDEQSEGQAGPDPGNARNDELSMPSLVVHAGSDCKHMDLDVADVSPQPLMEQMDEGFTVMVYSKVQENLKLTVEEQVLLEEPASSSGTLSSLQHLSKDIIFGDLFFSDKPSKANNDKANAETEVESMVLEERLDNHGECLYTLEKLDIPHQVSKDVNEVVTDAVDWAMQAPLRNCFRDLPEADMKEILHQRMWETESYKSYEDHMQLYEALEKSMNRDHFEELPQDLAKARKKKKKKKSHESPKTLPGSPPHQPPPPPPPAGPSRASRALGASGSSQVPPPPPPPSSTNQESQSKGFTAQSSSKTAALAEYQAWTTTDIRLSPSISLTPTDLQMDKDMAPDEQA